MKNFVQEGDQYSITLTAAVVAGDITLDGVLPAVAFSDGAVGDVIAGKSNGVFQFAADGTSTFAIGDLVYWDTLAKVVTSIPTATTATNIEIGKAFAAAAAAAPVLVLMNGFPS